MEIRGRTKDETEADVQFEGYTFLPLSSTYEYSTLLFLEEVLASGKETESEERIASTITDIVSSTPESIKGDLTEHLQENESETSEYVKLLLKAVRKKLDGGLTTRKRIFLFGLGQKNYVIRLFARRIQNIGFEVYVPGPRDIISKSRPGDIAIFVSNSGMRGKMSLKLMTAKEEGCHTVVITANRDSALAKDCLDISNDVESSGTVIPISSMTTGTHTADILDSSANSAVERAKKRAFEVAAMFYLEGISVALMKKLKIEAKDLLHVAKNWELKGSSAPSADPLIREVIRDGRMLEIGLEDGLSARVHAGAYGARRVQEERVRPHAHTGHKPEAQPQGVDIFPQNKWRAVRAFSSGAWPGSA